jgi:hypothetical protein
MQARSGQRREVLVPMAAAVAVALIGIAALVITEHNPAGDAQSSSISMITTAVSERAGATALPTDPTSSP